MITRNGIYYDLQFSIYSTRVNNIVFVFSSQSHLKKFKEKYVEHRQQINESLTKRFGFEINLSTLADIVLYRKIESRGFLIYNESGETICKNDLILNGEIPTLKNLIQLSNDSIQK